MMNAFNDLLIQHQWRHPSAFPNLRYSSCVLAISDYSGHHNASQYESYSFLYVPLESFQRFENRRIRLRREFGLSNRKMAFKDLRDRKRRRALDAFLRMADELDGMLATVLVDKRAGSLFDSREQWKQFSASWPDTEIKERTAERLLRVVHFNSFFLAGLLGSCQNIIWITDKDDIAANTQRLTILTEVWRTIFTHYMLGPSGDLNFQPGHLRCGTTASDNGSLQLEDLAAIPDLIAGTLAECWTCYAREESCIGKIGLPPPATASSKAKQVGAWLCCQDRPLRRHVFSIEPVGEQNSQLTIKRIDFHGATIY